MNPQTGAHSAFALMMGLNILLGLVLCFSGYLVSKIRVVLGAIVGCVIGSNIGFSASPGEWAAIVGGIMGGVVGAVVSTVFFFLGLFLIGALLGGFLASWAYATATGLPPQPWLVFICSMAAGGTVLLLRKIRVWVLIATTALAGAGLVVFGILSSAMGDSIGSKPGMNVLSNHGTVFGYSLLAGWLVLALCGMIVQYKLLPDADKKHLEKGNAEFNGSE